MPELEVWCAAMAVVVHVPDYVCVAAVRAVCVRAQCKKVRVQCAVCSVQQ